MMKFGGKFLQILFRLKWIYNKTIVDTDYDDDDAINKTIFFFR